MKIQNAISRIVEAFVRFNPNHLEYRHKNGRYLKTNLANCMILKFYPNIKKKIDRILIDNHVRYYEIANRFDHTSIIKAKRDIAILLYQNGNFTLNQIIVLSGLDSVELESVIDRSKLPKLRLMV